MNEFGRKLRVVVLVCMLIGVAVVSMLSDRRAILGGGRELPGWAGALLDMAVPIQKAVSVPVDGIRRGFGDYVALLDVREDNSSLRARIAQLEEDNLQLREALVEGGRLERIAEMREEFDVPMLPSQLVGVDSSPWFRSVLLDRGQDHGVRSGMPVISDDGLAGLVTATSASAAKTMLLLDRQSAVDAIVQRSRTRGIVRGQGGDELAYEFVVRGNDVQPGDVVITSGLGGVFPKGIRIGRITEVPAPGARLLQTATIEPAIDFGRLEQVFVMLRRGPTMELLYATEDGDHAQ